MYENNNELHTPEEELLETQEKILNVAIDIQALLRILVDKEIITKKEVTHYRNEVKNSPKYKSIVENIQKQKGLIQTVKDDPNAWLKMLCL